MQKNVERFGPVNWLPKSCELALLDHFLIEYVNALVYTNDPSLIELEVDIERLILEISPEICEKLTQSWTFRMVHLKRSHLKKYFQNLKKRK